MYYYDAYNSKETIAIEKRFEKLRIIETNRNGLFTLM